MYKPKNMKVNVIARTMVGVVELVFSLFTFPYVAKILGPTAVGQIDFVTVAVSYFVILGTFGIDNYGGREVAQNRTISEKVDDILSRLLGLRFLLAMGLFIIYLFLVVPFQGDNSVLFYCSSLMIVTTAFNLVWALEVLEDFSYLAITRLISKVAFIVYLFMFVQTPADAEKYFLSLIICDFLYYLFSIIRLKWTYKVSFSPKKMLVFLTKSEFLALSQIFFIILVQSSISGIPSIVMGKMGNFHDLGLLSTAQRFFWIGYYAIIPLSTVLQSRSMSFSGESSGEDRKKHLDRTANALLTFSVPITLGLILIAGDVVPLLVGNQYLDSIFLLQILSPLIILYSLNNFWSMQVVFSQKGDKALVITNLIGLFSMILFSIILIPWLQAKGAIIANLSTFLILSLVSYWFGRKHYTISSVMPDLYRVAFAGLAMYLALYAFKAPSFLWLVLKITVGAVIYFSTLYLVKHSLVRQLIKI
jgi:O-antigen/teichoic acid export membrane protein